MAELREQGIDASASTGHNGQFDVFRDGVLVFSKATEHRFPDDGEVLAALR
ncbi:MAG TPA: Rdx family protein [Gaiellaceae bacterium]|nr:Rdx family protein [Gaiellaceae bacterium]